MKFEFVNSILQIDRTKFMSLNEDDYPFLRYEFLAALEKSNSVCVETGWKVKHLTAWDNQELIGFMPLYLKSHSYGEYVFDFQWANAYHQSGLQYYPKLLSAVPFTPCSGPRIIIKSRYCDLTKKRMLEKVTEEAERIQASSFHYLFPNSACQPDINEVEINQSILHRVGMQYHWFNKDYKNFDDFLSVCKTKPRKNIRRERKSFIESDITIKTIEGKEISEQLWAQFYLFYCATYAKRSGNYGYLNEVFFQMIGTTMSSNIMMVVAYQNDTPIAISLFFKDDISLYGRYWGCSQEVEFLHFELCYYQGIEYCIKNNLEKFDAGAQGEHKIARGFKPLETHSYHWIRDSEFKDAINQFLKREEIIIEQTIKQLSQKLPFKQNSL